VRPNAWIPVRVALDEEHSALQLGLSVIVGIRKEAGEGQGDARSLARLPVAGPVR
jgi:hypothetical protein